MASTCVENFPENMQNLPLEIRAPYSTDGSQGLVPKPQVLPIITILPRAFSKLHQFYVTPARGLPTPPTSALMPWPHLPPPPCWAAGLPLPASLYPLPTCCCSGTFSNEHLMKLLHCIKSSCDALVLNRVKSRLSELDPIRSLENHGQSPPITYFYENTNHRMFARAVPLPILLHAQIYRLI